MQLIGIHKVKLYDKKNNLVDERATYNVITSKGRERILDIWAQNYWDSNNIYHKQIYGFEEIDLSPTILSNGDTRKSSFFDIGTTYDPNHTGSSGSRNLNSYDGWLDNPSKEECDKILYDTTHQLVTWTGGCGDNQTDFRYWHAIDLNRVETTEEFVTDFSSGDDKRDLFGSNLKFDYNSDKQFALKVTNQDGTTTYNINSDYTFDRQNGKITFLSSGSIGDGNTVKVIYKWHDISVFEDGIIGIYLNCWPRHNEGRLYHRSFFGVGRYSVTGGESWELLSWPWWGKPHDAYRSSHHDSWDFLRAPLFLPHFISEYDAYFFTYPYIINKPTNFAFVASFTFSPLYWGKWRFLKPKYQPQVPQVIALGDGTTSPTKNDTALDNEICRLNVASMKRLPNQIGMWKAFLDYDEQNGKEFKEVGLFFGDEWRETTEAGWTYFAPIKKENCNQLFSRTVYDESWTKTEDIRAELTYEISLVNYNSSSSSSSSSSS